MACVVTMFVLGYFYPILGAIANIMLWTTLILLIVDILMLFRPVHPVEASRNVPKRLSNGDANTISISLLQNYSFTVQLTLIDELPFQFQRRDHHFLLSLLPGRQKKISYQLTPTERGNYSFGALNIYAASPIHFIERRFRFSAQQKVPVYPSFVQMRKFELHAISNRLTDMGIKKIRRLGHTMEFDQIREYVRGDDVRSINWKATARSGDVMVNQYQDERSQRVYSIINTGRVMKMAFEGLTLMDHAINTSLAISNIALTKDDKAGLITFSDRNCNMVKAQKKRTHIYRIQEALYNIGTNFQESDYNRLLNFLHSNVKQRSLLFFYTNFENLSSMRRKLPILKQISSSHLLVIIFFVNTELNILLNKSPKDEEEVYIKTIAEKFSYEKKAIVKTLQQQGIQTILSPPKDLSINTINKYLELKARGLV